MTEHPWPTPSTVEEAEQMIDAFEAQWREYYAERAPIVRVDEGESPGDVLEVVQFAFGLMASIMRTSRAQVILVDHGYTVESRAMFRSILDQALALVAIESDGVHAVHAYGAVHAKNLKDLRDASVKGFELGDVNLGYIDMFMELSERLPRTDEFNRALNKIKTSTIGRNSGKFEAMLYQMWLEATPLSKPSMRLVDAYSGPAVVDRAQVLAYYIDSDPDSVVDPRLILASIIPPTLDTYGRVLRDDEFRAALRSIAE